MKQLYIQAATQHPKSIKDAFSVKNQSTIGRNSRRLTILNPNQPGGAFGSDKREWQGTGLCKGPPGRPRSPGIMFPEHPPARLRWSDRPDGGATPDRVPNPVGGNTPRNTGIQILKNNKFNFYSQSNFTIMKKQFLFLVFFVLAIIFAGFENAIGQTVLYKNYIDASGCVVSVPLNCVTAAGAPELSPKPGVTYTYTITTPGAPVSDIRWFVTDANTVIDGTGTAPILTTTRDLADGNGTYILSAPVAKYNVANTSPTIDISWKNFDGNAKEVLLVAYVTGAAGCSDNIQVWRIKPVFNFTLDVASVADNGSLGTTANPIHECVSNVESAVYNKTANELTMNYGTNYAFFSVNAANFVGSWMPTLSATATYGVVKAVTWAYPTEAVKNSGGIANGTWNATTVAVNASGGATASVGQTGECIIVRVEITNGKNEGLGDNTVELSVDGTMYNPAGTGDYITAALKDLDEGTPCSNTVTDKATYIIDKRPSIVESNPANPSFVPKN